MKFKQIVIPLLGIGALFAAWRTSGWGGVALVGGALVMWGLMHVTRMLQVMKRATDRPIGSVASAVMLNAKLKPGVTLLHVIAMTRSLGQRLTPKDEQPEIYRWRDAGGSFVTCDFKDGKLMRWEMVRPAPEDTAQNAPDGAAAAPAGPPPAAS